MSTKKATLDYLQYLNENHKTGEMSDDMFLEMVEAVLEGVADGTYSTASEMEGSLSGAKNIVKSMDDIYHAFRIKRSKGVCPNPDKGAKEAY